MIETTTTGRTTALGVVLLGIGLWTLAGCSTARAGREDRPKVPNVATQGRVLLRSAPVERHDVDERTYELGKRLTTRIGMPIIHLRSYSEEDTVARARFRTGFAASCTVRSHAFGQLEPGECDEAPLDALRAEPGETWMVAGVRADSSAASPTYLIGKNVEGGTLYLLVDATGRLAAGPNVAWRAVNAPSRTEAGLPLDLVKLDVPLRVEGPLVELERRRHILRGPSHLNFDLLYSGRGRSHRGASVRLLYKEYSPYLSGGPLHSEEFVYGLGDGTITFKNFRIRVHEAGNEEVTYTVESDAAKGG